MGGRGAGSRRGAVAGTAGFLGGLVVIGLLYRLLGAGALFWSITAVFLLACAAVLVLLLRRGR